MDDISKVIKERTDRCPTRTIRSRECNQECKNIAVTKDCDKSPDQLGKIATVLALRVERKRKYELGVEEVISREQISRGQKTQERREQKTVISFLDGASREPERHVSMQNRDCSKSTRRVHGNNEAVRLA